MSKLENLIEKVITADEDGKKLVRLAKKTAETLRNLKKNQIRKVFSEVRRIETMWETDAQKALRSLNLLKPKLYYQTKRKREVQHLERVLSTAIDQVIKVDDKAERKKRFDKFVDLFEAILAYHGGKK